MNIKTLNIASLDDGLIIKKGGGASGGGGTTPSKPKYTGHADAEGLRAIGWTDEDIAYYQENGVNWNEEDDQYHLVSDDNKALYGVLTASNISTYKDRIVYLPKIDTSGVTSMNNMFNSCYSLIAIPMLDTSNVTSMQNTFAKCYSLVIIPLLDTAKVASMVSLFDSCYSLTYIPKLNVSRVHYSQKMFNFCSSLKYIPKLEFSDIWEESYSMFENCRSLKKVDISGVGYTYVVSSMFSNCYSLTTIELDFYNALEEGNEYKVFSNCYSLTHAYLKNIALPYDLSSAKLLTKSSLLYLINNEAATSAITIKLASYAYDKWATDPDIVAALANHPNISISK